MFSALLGGPHPLPSQLDADASGAVSTDTRHTKTETFDDVPSPSSAGKWYDHPPVTKELSPTPHSKQSPSPPPFSSSPILTSPSAALPPKTLVVAAETPSTSFDAIDIHSSKRLTDRVTYKQIPSQGRTRLAIQVTRGDKYIVLRDTYPDGITELEVATCLGEFAFETKSEATPTLRTDIVPSTYKSLLDKSDDIQLCDEYLWITDALTEPQKYVNERIRLDIGEDRNSRLMYLALTAIVTAASIPFCAAIDSGELQTDELANLTTVLAQSYSLVATDDMRRSHLDAMWKRLVAALKWTPKTHIAVSNDAISSDYDDDEKEADDKNPFLRIGTIKALLLHAPSSWLQSLIEKHPPSPVLLGDWIQEPIDWDALEKHIHSLPSDCINILGESAVVTLEELRPSTERPWVNKQTLSRDVGVESLVRIIQGLLPYRVLLGSWWYRLWSILPIPYAIFGMESFDNDASEDSQRVTTQATWVAFMTRIVSLVRDDDSECTLFWSLMWIEPVNVVRTAIYNLSNSAVEWLNLWVQTRIATEDPFASKQATTTFVQRHVQQRIHFSHRPYLHKAMPKLAQILDRTVSGYIDDPRTHEAFQQSAATVMNGRLLEIDASTRAPSLQDCKRLLSTAILQLDDGQRLPRNRTKKCVETILAMFPINQHLDLLHCALKACTFVSKATCQVVEQLLLRAPSIKRIEAESIVLDDTYPPSILHSALKQEMTQLVGWWCERVNTRSTIPRQLDRMQQAAYVIRLARMGCRIPSSWPSPSTTLEWTAILSARATPDDYQRVRIASDKNDPTLAAAWFCPVHPSWSLLTSVSTRSPHAREDYPVHYLLKATFNHIMQVRMLYCRLLLGQDRLVTAYLRYYKQVHEQSKRDLDDGDLKSLAMTRVLARHPQYKTGIEKERIFMLHLVCFALCL